MGHKPRTLVASSGHSRELNPVGQRERRSWQGNLHTTDAEWWVAVITRWCLGVIALRWWQAWRFPAGSKIGKDCDCGAEVGKPGAMGVVLGC